ncbi:unnamed protein product [Microthlaspi erraticum]|uniref:Reverse transcriptase domain-containing protein n=1 Tax=Microthlaspi erraticum TaxID=1685480 RepID=A0A6D2HK07_9BRAS|nr:unnamed protein product [Microthlaspi erraticum]
MTYGIEAVVPADIKVTSLRRDHCPDSPELNEEMLRDRLDLIEEKRDQALVRIQNDQDAAARYYNSNVKPRRFKVDDLVLRKIFDDKDPGGKLRPPWNGPFRITEVVRDSVYKLYDYVKKVHEPRPWNAANLKRYY